MPPFPGRGTPRAEEGVVSENAGNDFCSDVIRYVGADPTTTPRGPEVGLSRQEEPVDDLSDLLVTRDPKKRVRCNSFDARL